MKRALILCLALLLLALPALAEQELIYRTEDVELHLPASWSESVLIVPTLTGASFYQKASYDRYMEEGLPGGGFLFTLDASVNNSYEELDSYIDLGLSEKSAMHYFLVLPTDYPAYLEDDEIREEWDAMQAAVRGIAQGSTVY